MLQLLPAIELKNIRHHLVSSQLDMPPKIRGFFFPGVSLCFPENEAFLSVFVLVTGKTIITFTFHVIFPLIIGYQLIGCQVPENDVLRLGSFNLVNLFTSAAIHKLNSVTQYGPN